MKTLQKYLRLIWTVIVIVVRWLLQPHMRSFSFWVFTFDASSLPRVWALGISFGLNPWVYFVAVLHVWIFQLSLTIAKRGTFGNTMGAPASK